ncbi:MAG TPA: VTT domain-containing protein [Steroidobacteraceae bacterium]|nr:VTT domain-containing protein [Steroidobacteraceae bacterium]
MPAREHACRVLDLPRAIASRRAALLAGACIILAAVASSRSVHESLLSLLEATQSIIGRYAVLGAITFVLLAAISAMLAFVSVAVIVPAAVFAWGAPVSIGLLWLGWILGGVATYGIGRYLGRPAAHWLTAEGMLRKLEEQLSPRTPLWMITLLQLALPSEIPGYVMGLVRYPISRYLLALAVAELPFTVATVYLGDSFVAGRGGLILAIGALLALGSICAVYAVRRLTREAR